MQTPPSELAARLVRADAALQQRVTVGAAWAEQRIELRLAGDPALAPRVIRLLPPRLAHEVTDDVLAQRALARVSSPRPPKAFRIGPAAAAATLRAYYRDAQRRSGVAWQLLAAINYVESDFGRVRSPSGAGAIGPMQFMPSTWAAYGRGSARDPRQAILAAGRFLRAAGAPADERGALYRYNPSLWYVEAIERLSGRIRRDPRAFLVFYARPLIVRTPNGYRRLT
jgi:membrane-bound lytic murein transglycosylase B